MATEFYLTGTTVPFFSGSHSRKAAAAATHLQAPAACCWTSFVARASKSFNLRFKNIETNKQDLTKPAA